MGLSIGRLAMRSWLQWPGSSLIGGMIEVLGGFIGRWIVKVVPHSA